MYARKGFRIVFTRALYIAQIQRIQLPVTLFMPEYGFPSPSYKQCQLHLSAIKKQTDEVKQFVNKVMQSEPIPRTEGFYAIYICLFLFPLKVTCQKTYLRCLLDTVLAFYRFFYILFKQYMLNIGLFRLHR